MSSTVLDDLASPWPAQGWQATLTQLQLADGRTRPALHVAAVSSTGSETVRRDWSPALDLRAYDELHFTWRSSRAASSKSNQSFYLALACYENPDLSGASWMRLLPAARPNVWESVELWLGDMPAALRQNVSVIVLRPINNAAVFTADVLPLVGVTKQPIADVDQAWLARLHERFSVEHDGSLQAVPALIELPESNTAHPPLCIVISPWAMRSVPDRAASGQIIDNFTPDGAAYRRQTGALELAFRVDVFAATRAQKAAVFDAVVADLTRYPVLALHGAFVACESFVPEPVQLLQVPAGRASLFYRVHAPFELADPMFVPVARPYFQFDHADRGPRPENLVL